MIAPSRRSSLRGPAGLLVLLAATLCPAAGAGAVEGAAQGAFDLALDAAHQCRLTLRSEPTETGFAIAMPAGCHRAFATLGPVARWSRSADGGVTFVDPSGAAILTFEAVAEGLEGTGPDGQTYRLRPVGRASLDVLKAVDAGSDGSGGTGEDGARLVRVAATAKPPATAPKAALKVADVAGRYAILREKDKDTGCMLTLDDKAHGPGPTLKARLAPACRDQGIVIFDPVGWQVEAGRLVLTARKGHTTRLDTQDDGTWMKDPKEGKSLSLKKM